MNNPTGGAGATIGCNPSVNFQLNNGVATPSVVVLFQEPAHTYNMTTGTGLGGVYTDVNPNNNRGGINNTERQGANDKSAQSITD